ncbi:MAG: cell division protein FtsL [Proteobacteria bacterium]|nr:cell division protein FtsL [Pseudomonadota bacterium]
MTKDKESQSSLPLKPPSNRVWQLILLSLLVFSSALAVVYYKHQSRLLFTQLQTLNEEIEALQVEWGQLLLEQGTWSSDARVERLAREQLQMAVPEPNTVVVIKEPQESR